MVTLTLAIVYHPICRRLEHKGSFFDVIVHEVEGNGVYMYVRLIRTEAGPRLCLGCWGVVVRAETRAIEWSSICLG